MKDNRKKGILFFCLAFLLASFFAYVQLFATREAKVFMGVWNIDKLFHIMGGISLALFFEWIPLRRTLPYLMTFLFASALGWELFEYLFLPDVTYFAHHSPVLWRFDVLGDIVAAFLGAYSYWVFLKNGDSRRLIQRTAQISVERSVPDSPL